MLVKYQELLNKLNKIKIYNKNNNLKCSLITDKRDKMYITNRSRN